jgi:uncharacterized protein YjbI with pentapeptide repeats
MTHISHSTGMGCKIAVGLAMLRTVRPSGNLNGANMEGADLSEADVAGANLLDAFLTGADLRGTDIAIRI